MKSGCFIAVLAVVGVFLAAGPAAAQQRRLSNLNNNNRGSSVNTNRGAAGDTAAAEGSVKIERFPAPGKASMVRSPEFNVNANGLQPPLSARKREWALFEIKYSTSAKWMDELSFTYHVLTKGKDEKGADAFNYFTTTVRYVDIPKGEHMSAVALPPSTVERHGAPVALALEIVGDSNVLDSKSESAMSLPKEWWKDSKVMDDQRMHRRSGLVDRSKTPFALINPNDYEVVQ